MMISTKGRYALTTLIDISVHQSERSPVPIKEIADRKGISVKYLEQIISLMVKCGLLKSIRGAKGGYLLTKPAEAIRVGEILDAAEGTLAPVSCVQEGNSCQKAASCPAFPLYKEIDDAIYEVVNRYTLQDVVKKELENITA